MSSAAPDLLTRSLPRGLSQEDIESYRLEGYVVVRGVLSSGEINELRQACDALCAHAQGFTDDRFEGVTFFNMHRNANPFDQRIKDAPVVAGQLRRVTYPYAFCDTFNRYRAHPTLLAAVAAVLGPDLVQIVNQINFNPPGIGTGWGWHQDYRFRKAGGYDLMHGFVQSIIAIDVCNAHTGGIKLVPRSYELGPLKLDADHDQAESYFDASTAITPELQPGDAILFNAYMIHGSGANHSQHLRRVYINGYASAAHATIGIPVLQQGQATCVVQGDMEYEGDQKILPLASKY